MPISVFDHEFQDVLRNARRRRSKEVVIDGTRRKVPIPFPSPVDWRDKFIYFIMIDRFNNPSSPAYNAPFDAKFGGFQGGTLNGIRAKLGYLKGLGVGAIWLTPVLKNPQYLNDTYHGYGIQDFLKVDPRFGDEADLQALVLEAHAKGIYVILDIVLNHAGDVFEYEGLGATAEFRDTPYPIQWRKADGQGNPLWREAPDDIQQDDPDNKPDALLWPVELMDNRFFRRQGKSDTERSGALRGDFESLKEFVTEFHVVTPQRGPYYPVRDTLIKIYQYAIAKFDVDGFRIDTLKHVERDFARIFGNAMREFALSIGKRNFFTFGEVAGDEQKIAEYTGRFASDPDDLMGVDAALDFPLFYKLPGVLKGFDAPSQVVEMFENRKNLHRGRYGHGVLLSSHGEVGQYFVTFLDNHDQHNRFYFSTSDDAERYEAQMTMGVSCLFCLQGIPCLYYGTEQGLHGMGDSDQNVREALWGKTGAFDTDNPFYKAIQRIANIRKEHRALQYGRQYFREISGNGVDFGISTTIPGVLAFSRILNDAEVLVIVNTQTDRHFQGFVNVDFSLNPPETSWRIIYSNLNTARTAHIIEKSEGAVMIRGIDGKISSGPLRIVSVEMKPMEIQLLGRQDDAQSG
jgi:glycosidase